MMSVDVTQAPEMIDPGYGSSRYHYHAWMATYVNILPTVFQHLYPYSALPRPVELE